jgi:hypothetical protein
MSLYFLTPSRSLIITIFSSRFLPFFVMHSTQVYSLVARRLDNQISSHTHLTFAHRAIGSFITSLYTTSDTLVYSTHKMILFGEYKKMIGSCDQIKFPGSNQIPLKDLILDTNLSIRELNLCQALTEGSARAFNYKSIILEMSPRLQEY